MPLYSSTVNKRTEPNPFEDNKPHKRSQTKPNLWHHVHFERIH